MRHARFETYAGTKRHLFEDEAEHLAFENLGIFGSVSFLESGFDRFGDLQNRLEFVNVDVVRTDLARRKAAQVIRDNAVKKAPEAPAEEEKSAE